MKTWNRGVKRPQRKASVSPTKRLQDPPEVSATSLTEKKTLASTIDRSKMTQSVKP